LGGARLTAAPRPRASWAHPGDDPRFGAVWERRLAIAWLTGVPGRIAHAEACLAHRGGGARPHCIPRGVPLEGDGRGGVMKAWWERGRRKTPRRRVARGYCLAAWMPRTSSGTVWNRSATRP
jgi:hypothetical protein